MARSRFFRLLLRVYPPAFRAEFGEEMEAAFAECAERERDRRFAAVRIPLRATADTVRHATQVRLEARRARRRDRHVVDFTRHGADRTASPMGSRMSQMLQDVRYALRLLRKDRSFTATVLLTLAICIGGNAAIFAVVHSVLLRPLPVPEPHRLVNIVKSYPKAGAERTSNSVPDYYDRLEALDTMEELALYRRSGVTIGFDSGADRLIAVQATPSLFRLLRTRPIAGDIFHETEGEPGNDRKVLISHGLWRTRYAGRPDVLGQEIRINGAPHTIVGIMPADFQFVWADVSLWIPLAFAPGDRIDDRRHSNSYQMVGRLKPGASLEQAQAQLDAIDRRNHERFPELRQILEDAGFHTRALAFQDDLVREIRPMLVLLWGGVLFVLLIGAVNITNLAIVRSSARQRELATRHAIGAGIGRLVRQLITEGMLLAAAGGALGLLLGRWSLNLVPTLGLHEIPRGHEITMTPETIMLILGLSLIIGLVVSLVAAGRVWRLNLSLALRQEGRGGTASRRSMMARRSLATAQVGFAFLLLIGAGLLSASFRQVLRVSPGFDAAGVLAGHVSLPRTRYADSDGVRAFAARALERLRATAGIERAGITDTLPFGGIYSDSLILAEGYVMSPGESFISPLVSSVSEGYFETMGIALVRGRYLDGQDTSASEKVAIVDRKLARKFWPGQDPIGRRLFTPGGNQDVTKPGPSSTFYTVVGVVEDVTLQGLTEEAGRVGAYYFPLAQRPTTSFAFVARTPLAPEAASEAIRRELAAIDPELPVHSLRTMTDRLDESVANRRLAMLVALVFAGVALFLSATGIYGVLAYQVAQRRREIGIRMALGSSLRAVVRLVLFDGAKIVGVGLVLGFAAALPTGRYLESQLFGVRALDPAVIGTVAVILAAVSFVAVSIPARRAAKVNPVIALSGE